ncbi:MAG: HNH endonuclease, partial [Chloroflexi bacterium]|nr:HNH endonuclease [Chloroflexota bacterium]
MPDNRVSKQQREQVAARAKYYCEYCLSSAHFAVQSFSVEHILPLSKGGKTHLDNLALACQGCNNHKYTKPESTDPVTGATVPLYHPRQHQWKQHFVWSEDFLTIQGIL